MTTKIHLRANKLINTDRAMAICATQRVAGRGVRYNGRSTYKFMASEVVSFEDFKNVPAADRCAHCMDRGLIVRNRQRREKGLAPVAALFD